MTETKQIKIGIENLEMDHYELVDKTEKMKTFVEADTENKVCLNITIRNLEVKYLPKLYDKLVMVPDDETLKWIQQWEEHAKETIDCEPFIKNGMFGCKPSGQLKEELNKTLKDGDVIDIVITYNGISYFQEKWYPNFTLQQFRKVKSVKRKVVNLFVD